VLQAIGDVLQFKDRRDEALSSYAEALAIFKDINARLGEANVYDSLALVSSAQANFPAALDYHHQALQIFQMMESPYNEGWSWLYIARTQVKLNQPYPAKESYELAQGQFAAVGMDDLVAMCRQEMQPTNQISAVRQVAPSINPKPNPKTTTGSATSPLTNAKPPPLSNPLEISGCGSLGR
jgi:tetratricopeptide (TPR) repeat protein